MCSCSGLVCGNELPIFFFGSRDHHDLHSFPTRRSSDLKAVDDRLIGGPHVVPTEGLGSASTVLAEPRPSVGTTWGRSEEHTSELQSQFQLVCRLLLEKKNTRSTVTLSGR